MFSSASMKFSFYFLCLGFHLKSYPHISFLSNNLSFCHQELGRTEGMSQEEAVRLITRQQIEEQPHGKGWYRINACRGLTGGRRLLPPVKPSLEDVSLILY